MNKTRDIETRKVIKWLDSQKEKRMIKEIEIGIYN